MAIFDLLRTPAQKTLYNHLYWLTEIVADLLLFSVIIALAHQATPEGSIRRKIDRLLAAAAGAVVLLPFLIPHPPFDPWPTTNGSTRWQRFSTSAPPL